MLQDALDAKEANNPVLTRIYALAIMENTQDESVRLRAISLYAWALSQLGSYGESLQWWRLLQKMNTRRDGKLSYVEAIMIVQQVRLLRLLDIPIAARALQDELTRRICQETSGATQMRINTKVRTMLAEFVD